MAQSIVTSSPDILSGTPVFTGTRVPVQALIDYLEGGETIDDFLAGFPTVERAQVVAFLEEAYAVFPSSASSLSAMPRLSIGSLSLKGWYCSRQRFATAWISWRCVLIIIYETPYIFPCGRLPKTSRRCWPSGSRKLGLWKSLRCSLPSARWGRTCCRR